MTVAGAFGGGVGVRARPARVAANVRQTVATLLRPPRRSVSLASSGPSRRQWALGAALAVAAVFATMWLLDAASLANVRRLPAGLVAAFGRLTDFGLSGWFLWPTGLVLIALALLDSPAKPAFARQVLAAWAVRLGFVFLAVGLPGLFVSIVKRLIGRARPFVDGDGVWSFMPLGWQVDHASLPSGHATTAFAALVAIGALFPQARALMWIYAVLIALSRVAVTAHHPSDVVAGAIVGAVGALLVRDWFASRGLGFFVAADGGVRPLPGPSVRRIVKSVARAARAA